VLHARHSTKMNILNITPPHKSKAAIVKPDSKLDETWAQLAQLSCESNSLPYLLSHNFPLALGLHTKSTTKPNGGTRLQFAVLLGVQPPALQHND